MRSHPLPRTAVVAALLALLALVAPPPAAGGPTEQYPDPPTGGAEAAPASARSGGVFEEANWLPLLGNHELWCTNGNPGYAGCRRHHGYPAIDIGMPVGTRVYAAGPGTVLFAGSAGDARGTYVEIRHPDGIRSRYYHLSATRVRRNQRVERGSLIGLSGRTGRATSPHLHYEERTASGGAKDPGVMFAIVGGRLVAYPDRSGHTNWNRTPYGTRLRNAAFAVDNTALYWGGPGVASGDFDGDEVDDVVVGVPGEDTVVTAPNGNRRTIDSGGAHVLYGQAAAGLAATGAERLLQGVDGLRGAMENNEVAGAAVAVGDFDGDDHDDVAIGAPAATVSGFRAAGEVIAAHGSPEGLLPGPRSVRLVGVRPEAGDQFGAALASGDFDGDGFDDLAVGAPAEGILGVPVAGAVTVFRGSAAGLTTTGREISAAPAAVAGRHEAGDRLGVAVAAGDVDGDGIDDLAVGIPGEDTVDGQNRAAGDAGAVLVLPGRPATGPQPGLRGAGSVELHADSPGVAGDGRAGDQLGVTVAVGDVHDDGFADVVAGAVGKDIGRATDAGAVLVLRGRGVGVRAAGSRQVHADVPGVAGAAQAGDRLGSGVALADLDGDGDEDLVVGVAGQAVGNARGAGAALVLLGGAQGLVGAGSRQLHAGSPTTALADAAERDDVLGASVAAGDLDGDGFGDLVLGAPGEDVAGRRDAGAVTIAYGTGTGPRAVGSRLFHGGNSGSQSQGEAGDRWGGLFPIYLR